MADQLVFNSSLNILNIGTGLTTLTGSVDVSYGATDTVTGSVSLTALGTLGVQTYTNLAVSQTGTATGGTPIYTLTGSNLLTSVSITYTGQLPTTSSASVTTVLNLTIATGTGNVTSTPVCYAHGTRILTDRGEVAVENLKVGDMVVTPHGPTATMPIRWIGHQHFEAEAARFLPFVSVRAGALGDGLPHRDLIVSADHCLYLDGRLVPAKLLANGSTIIVQRGDRVTDYINIELDQHMVIIAEGVESESYLNCGNRARFDNAAEPSEWVASRPVGSNAAWHDGTAFAEPLWSGPKLDALVARLASIPMDIAIAA